MSNRNYYMCDEKINSGWASEPADQWGIIVGAFDNASRELPPQVVQRKDVPVYAGQQITAFSGTVSYIQFVPEGSKRAAEARVREIEKEEVEEVRIRFGINKILEE